MTSRWVAHASPLILLGKADQLGLLTRLFDTLIAPEIVIRGERQAR